MIRPSTTANAIVTGLIAARGSRFAIGGVGAASAGDDFGGASSGDGVTARIEGVDDDDARCCCGHDADGFGAAGCCPDDERIGFSGEPSESSA